MLGYSESRILGGGGGGNCIDIYGYCYPITIINVVEWLCADLRYNDGGAGLYIYNNDPTNLEKFGYLYNYAAAIRVSNDIETNYGFRLPTKLEAQSMFNWVQTDNGRPINYTSLDELKSLSGDYWTHPGITDKYGFDLRGTGYWRPNTYSLIMTYGYMWTSTSVTSTLASRAAFSGGSNYRLSYSWSDQDKLRAFPVRLIRV